MSHVNLGSLCAGRGKKRKVVGEGQQAMETEDAAEGGVMRRQSPDALRGGSCSCRASGSSLIGGSGAGWEGTALLHHGSCIKLGCQQFLFSITEFAARTPGQEESAAPPTLSCSPAASLQGAAMDLKPAAAQLHQVPVLLPSAVP